LRHVRKLIAPKWYDVGLELMEEKDVEELRVIKTDYDTNVSKACEEMLELWLRKKPESTWNQLIEAVKAPDIELNSAATKIEEMLTPSIEGIGTVHFNFTVHNVVRFYMFMSI